MKCLYQGVIYLFATYKNIWLEWEQAAEEVFVWLAQVHQDILHVVAGLIWYYIFRTKNSKKKSLQYVVLYSLTLEIFEFFSLGQFSQTKERYFAQTLIYKYFENHTQTWLYRFSSYYSFVKIHLLLNENG